MSTSLPAQWNAEAFQSLTPREQAFVLDPEAFTNPVNAALRAGYSKTTAQSQGHMMRKQLMFYIMPQHQQRMDSLGAATLERIVQELEAIAFAKESDYYLTVDTEDETIKVLKDVTRLPEPMQRAVQSVEYETVNVMDGDRIVSYQKLVRLKLYDKMAALKELAEIRGGHDPRLRKPETENEDQELLQHLEPEELEQIEKLYGKAAARVAKAKNRKLDANAIPGEVVRRKSK